jgi:hypothetical protein
MSPNGMAGVESTMEGSVPKKTARVFPFFRDHLHPIPELTTCPSSPVARKPTNIVTQPIFQEKSSNDAKENVSHSKTKMEKMVRRREVPCAHRPRLLYSG